MQTLDYTLYDTAPFGTSGGTLHTLFQTSQGADSTHTKSYTNSRGAGQLPSEESFQVEHIGIFLDVNGIAADRENMWLGSYLEVRVSDETVLLAPLSEFAQHNSFGGVIAQATGADEALIGRQGLGRSLEIPIEIPGGTSFRVDVYQGTATQASQNVKVLLKGKLTKQ